MAETTNIEWADGTLNYWIGCTEVSNGENGACTNCYARTWAARWPEYRGTWGPHAPRVQTKDPLTKARAIIRAAAKRGIAHPFIFSNSLADIFDNVVPIMWLAEAVKVVIATPQAVHLWLTKRPGNIVPRMREVMDILGLEEMPGNIAFGMTSVTQDEIVRDTRKLLAAKAELDPAFTFLSIEPMRGPMRLSEAGAIRWNTGGVDGAGDNVDPYAIAAESVDWVICGFESGTKARPSHPQWARDLARECDLAGIPFMFKQWGEWVSVSEVEGPQTAFHQFPDGACVRRVGKARAGRTLDGKTYDARPFVPPSRFAA